MSNLSCHIIGLNPYLKNDITTNLNIRFFNIIDLDTVNQDILHDENMDKMYFQYQKLKDDKNDKFKEVDKRMTEYWQSNFITKIEKQVKQNKTNILIGQNCHYKSLTKRVPIESTNKFIVSCNEDDIKEWIKYNLETYKDDIVNGTFPLDYINHDFLTKKRQSLETTYKKLGYIEKSYDQLKTILQLMEETKNNNKMWIGMKEPYNVGSLIHPIVNNKVIAFTDPTLALLSSINFNKDEIITNFNGTELKLKELKPKGLNKLKTRRYLYLVESKSFAPHESGSKVKFFSQLPVKILSKERINNVHDYLFDN